MYSRIFGALPQLVSTRTISTWYFSLFCLPSRVFVVEETVAHLKACLRTGDWVLVKGSRKMKMEEIVQAILGAIGVAK